MRREAGPARPSGFRKVFRLDPERATGQGAGVLGVHPLPLGSLVPPAGPRGLGALSGLRIPSMGTSSASAVGPTGSLAPDPISHLRGPGLG